ncbi:MAG: cyclic nucleotide-binding domain-containing protein [Actinomycetota bacterium]
MREEIIMVQLRKKDPKIERLRELAPFSACGPEELRAVAGIFDETRFDAGQIIVREGTVGQEFFVIERGLASVTSSGRPLATLGPGEFIGELAALRPGPRSATVIAKTPMQVFVASGRSIDALFERAPSTAMKLAAELAKRLRIASATSF